MKNLGVTLALAAALAAGTFSSGAAEAKGRRDGAHPQRHAAAQHHRAGQRTHAAARRGVGHRPIGHSRVRAAKRFAHLKRRHQRYRHTRQRRHLRRFHRPPRYVRHIHHAPDYAPAYSRALEVETPEFRFSVSASG